MIFSYPAAPALARPEPFHASALKAPPKAGWRGGESFARQNNYQYASKSIVSLSGASSLDNRSICITTGVWKAVPDSTHAPDGNEGIRERDELSRLFKEFFNKIYRYH